MSDARFRPDRPGPDPLGSRLDALRAETDRFALPGASSIRRHGNRRSAIQVAGTTLAAASAIGLGAFVLPFGGAAENDPITPPSTTTTTTTPTGALVPRLSDAVLLDAAGLEELRIFPEGGALRWSVDSTHEDPGLALTSVCLPRLSSPDSIQSLAAQYLPAEPETSEPPAGRPTAAAEVVIVQSDHDAAAGTAVDLREWLLACGQVDDGAQVVGVAPLAGAADGGYLVDLLQTVPGTDVGLAHQVAVGTSGPVVVGVLLTTTSQESPAPDAALALLQAAMVRLCEAASVPCPADKITDAPLGGDPSGDPTGLPPSDPMLDLAQLPTWDGVLPWDTSFDVEDVESGPYGVVCHPLWRDLGATEETQRQFSVVAGSSPGDEPTATEVVADFADEPAAVSAMDTMRDAMAGCQGSDQVAPDLLVEHLGTTTNGGEAWLVTLPSSGGDPQRVLVGLAHSGTRAALVTVTHARAESLEPEPFLSLLSTVIEGWAH